MQIRHLSLRMLRRFSLLPVVSVGVICLACLAPNVTAAPTASPNVVISQVFGGGGNAGAPYDSDFVELFNRGTIEASLAGWSVQYASATGDTWQVAMLTGTLPPGGYFLVQLARGVNPAPTFVPDASFGIAASASSGKFALRNTIAALGVACPSAGQVVDLVGYGSANCAEGSPVAALSSQTSASRVGAGCADTDSNTADFVVGSVTPRNSLSVQNPCTAGIPTRTPGPTPAPTRTPVLPLPFPRIRDLQGAGHVSLYRDNMVSQVPGVVTAVRNQSFYFQDPSPDTDDATSEGMLVFVGSAPGVLVGDLVSVTGVVSEFRASDAAYLSITEIAQPMTIEIVSRGHPLPTAIRVGSGGRLPPNQVFDNDANGDLERKGTFDPGEDGIDFWESLEGMLIEVNDVVAVGATSSFGEVPVIVSPDAGLRTGRGGLIVRPGDFNPERLTIDDAFIGAALPKMNVGDAAPGPITGVVDYSFGAYKLLALAPFTVAQGSLTPERATAADAGELSVAAINVENLSATDTQARFDGFAGQIVEVLKAPDLLCLSEVQDNDGSLNSGVVDASLSAARLLSAVVAAGGPNYSYLDIAPQNNADGGEVGGNIRLAYLVKQGGEVSARIRPGGSPTQAVAVLPGPALDLSPGRIEPANSNFDNSRKPLALELEWRGRTLFAVCNHWVSRSADDPLQGRYQPPVRHSEPKRAGQAEAIAAFVRQITVQDPDARILVLGDLNEFHFSPAFDILEDVGLHALVKQLPENERYSYVFEGNSQVLDHILVSTAFLSHSLSYDIVHANAEFATRLTDHDPVLLRIGGVVVTPTPTHTPTPTIAGTHTPVPPTATPTATQTPTATPTSPSAVATATLVPTATPTPNRPIGRRITLPLVVKSSPVSTAAP